MNRANKKKKSTINYVNFLVFIPVLLLCSCTIYETRKSEPVSVASPKSLSVPVGKNWKIVEEPPKLSDERGRLPFQTEQSIQPEVVKPVVPEDNRTIETPR